MDETIIFEGRMSWRSFHHIFGWLFGLWFSSTLGYVGILGIAENAKSFEARRVLSVLFFLVPLLLAAYMLVGLVFYVWYIVSGRVDRQILFRGGLQMSYGERVYKIRWKDIGKLIAWRAPWASGYSIYVQVDRAPFGSTGSRTTNPRFLIERTFTYEEMNELFQKIRSQAIAPPECVFYESSIDKLLSYLRGR